MKYIVFVREKWIQGYEVEAASEGDAKTLVALGEGSILEDSFEYVEALESDTWSVTKAPEEMPNDTDGKTDAEQAQRLPNAKGIPTPG